MAEKSASICCIWLGHAMVELNKNFSITNAPQIISVHWLERCHKLFALIDKHDTAHLCIRETSLGPPKHVLHLVWIESEKDRTFSNFFPDPLSNVLSFSYWERVWPLGGRTELSWRGSFTEKLPICPTKESQQLFSSKICRLWLRFCSKMSTNILMHSKLPCSRFFCQHKKGATANMTIPYNNNVMIWW